MYKQSVRATLASRNTHPPPYIPVGQSSIRAISIYMTVTHHRVFLYIRVHVRIDHRRRQELFIFRQSTTRIPPSDITRKPRSMFVRLKTICNIIRRHAQDLNEKLFEINVFAFSCYIKFYFLFIYIFLYIMRMNIKLYVFYVHYRTFYNSYSLDSQPYVCILITHISALL